MIERAYHFDAFISYRHTERDKKIVDTIQKLTENYRAPCDGTHIKKGERIRRIFTDRSELPMSADLGASITDALAQSRFLVVIASPEYTQSRWCMEELRTFLRFHQYSTDRILFVQVDGSPSCITEILSAAGVCVEKDSFREPLYIDACASNTKNSIKIIRKEYLRLAAVLIGCGYDALYQRHKRAIRRRSLIAAAFMLLVGAVFSTVFVVQSRQKQREMDYREIDASISAVHDLLRDEDRVDALAAMQELYDRYAQDEAYSDYLAQQLDSAAVSTGYVPAFSAFAVEPKPFENLGISVSSDGKYVIVFDVTSTREEGKMKLSLYDAYLSKHSEYILPVEEWKDQLVLGSIFDTLRIDYHEKENAFELELLSDDTKDDAEILGSRMVFSAEGQLLSSQALTADEDGRTSPEVRELYRDFTSIYDNPVCMSSDCLYTVITEGESTYEPFGEKNEVYCLVSKPVTGGLEITATLERTSEIHALDDVSVTSDDRFVLVKETRGIYNDVLTVCDAEGQWDSVRIDLGNHTVQDMQYRFDTEKQEACFLFNLSEEGASSLIAECRIASGRLLNFEMYRCGYVYDCILSKQGFVYIVDDAAIKAISTRNLCLPERMAGIDTVASVRTDTDGNDLIEHADKFSPDSTGGMQSISVGNLTVTPDVVRLHHDSPDSYSGNDIGVGIHDSTGEALVEFFSADICHAYFNKQDGVFGLIDYASPENSEVFRLYDFYGMMELLR